MGSTAAFFKKKNVLFRGLFLWYLPDMLNAVGCVGEALQKKNTTKPVKVTFIRLNWRLCLWQLFIKHLDVGKV